MRKLFLLSLFVPILFISYTKWYTEYRIFSDTLWATIYWSDWSYGRTTSNTFWTTIYFSQWSPKVYSNPNIDYYYNNQTKDLLNKYETLLNQYNREYIKKLDDDCSKSVISFVDDAQNACYNEDSPSCYIAMEMAKKVINAWLSNEFLWDVCKFAIELWLAKLNLIEANLSNNFSSDGCLNWEYFDTYLQKCLERPDYHKWVNNWYEGSDWKVYCNEWFLRNLDLANCVKESEYESFRFNNWCPKNSSLADNGTCYCNIWYKNNVTNDWCVIDGDYCSNTYWINMKNSSDENWNPMCSCKFWFYFDESEQKCLSVKTFCKEVLWEHSNRSLESWKYSCTCKEWFLIDENWICNNKEVTESIARMYDNWLTIYNSIDSFMWLDYLTREQASKFFVEFSEKIRWIKIDTTKKVSFRDLKNADKTLQSHIKKSNQLGLFNGVDWNFLPFDKLTRAQAIAVVIRSIDWIQDESGLEWYENYYNTANYYNLLYWLDFDFISLDSTYIKRFEIALLLYRAKFII